MFPRCALSRLFKNSICVSIESSYFLQYRMNAQKRQLSPVKHFPDAGLKKQKLMAHSKLNSEIGVENDSDFLLKDDDDHFFADMEALHELTPKLEQKFDSNSWKRCVVETVERDAKTFDLVLRLSVAEDEKSQLEEANKENISAIAMRRNTICRLQGAWSQTHIEVGNILCVSAPWDEQRQEYKVNNDVGFCVTNPDTLISGTSVVGSLFCRRKAVLQDRFRGIDANNRVMVIGSLVHELLQIVLAKELRSYKQIQDVAKELLDSQETAYMLYGNLMTRSDAELELQKFVPNILNFVQQYIVGRGVAPAATKDQFEGIISEIEDIEENLWVPQLGLKGKIDVSVRIKRRRRNNQQSSLNFPASNANASMPLEIKTGRATFSMEHKGQLMLYQMMLTAAGKETNSGLLLYLREGIMREIDCTHNEERDLIMLRNDLSHYLSKMAVSDALTACGPLSLGDGKLRQPFELPEPITHHSACSNCAYATLCCSFAKTNAALQLSAAHPLLKVMEAATSHLESAHYEYFIHWCRLLMLEEQELRKSQNLRSLWTDPAVVRARNGRAIVGLVLHQQKSVAFNEGRYLNTFQMEKKNNSELEGHGLDLTLCGFSLGEYVIVSSAQRLAIAAGCIHDITKDTISISLERNLCKNYAEHSFIVDKHESQSSNVFNYTNLGLLLDNTERAASLRAIIVQRVQPTFVEWRGDEGGAILKELNDVQCTAVKKALTTDSFMLIKGLPGTGKTQTLVAIVRILHLMGKSVLITSHTHSAVDNLMLRLQSHSLPMLRLGSTARIDPQLHAIAESTLTADCRTESDIKRIYGAYKIVGVTCLGSAHSIFLHRSNFDYCIVDEATQVMQSTVLRPLFFAQKFILVGDPDQLPPLVRSREARQLGADESLFQRLDTTASTSVLTLQYRMNKTITKLANRLTYDGNLHCASKDVEDAVMRVTAAPQKQISMPKKWLERILSTHIDQAVVFLDTGDCSERSIGFANAKQSKIYSTIETIYAEELSAPAVPEVPLPMAELDMLSDKCKSNRKRISKYTNYCDAAVIFYIVKHLLAAGYEASSIGIIAPYRAQVELLRKLAEQYAAATSSPTQPVEVNTVDQYQGRDKQIIIYSCTKTGPTPADNVERSRDAEILEDKRRLTVAITRAKYKLILIGDSSCLQQYTPFRTLLSRIPSCRKLLLEEGRLKFAWEPLLRDLSDLINC